MSVVGEMFCSVPSSIMHDLDIPQKTTGIALGMGLGIIFTDVL